MPWCPNSKQFFNLHLMRGRGWSHMISQRLLKSSKFDEIQPILGSSHSKRPICFDPTPSDPFFYKILYWMPLPFTFFFGRHIPVIFKFECPPGMKHANGLLFHLLPQFNIKSSNHVCSKFQGFLIYDLWQYVLLSLQNHAKRGYLAETQFKKIDWSSACNSQHP